MLRPALTELAALDVIGVRHNHGIETLPDTLSRGMLPVLLTLPIETAALSDNRLFKERGQGFESLGFSGGARSVIYSVTHLLLAAPTGAGAGLRSHVGPLVDLIDAYFAALSAAPTLNGHLLEPALVRVEPGVFPYGGVDYFGCAFRHRWVVQP